MKINNGISFTGFIVTKGPDEAQNVLQSALSGELVESNNPGKYGKSIDYTNNMNYHWVLFDNKNNKSFVIHATLPEDVRKLQALSHRQNWIKDASKIKELISNNEVPTYHAVDVFKGIKNRKFNPQLARFAFHKRSPKPVEQKFIVLKSSKPVDLSPVASIDTKVPSSVIKPVKTSLFGSFIKRLSMALKALI